MLTRTLTNILQKRNTRNRIIIVLGARQVGKTTMVRDLVEKSSNHLSLNCDDRDDAEMIEDKTSTELKNLLGKYDYVFIDEAQRVKNIGLTLKKIGDLKFDTKVIVTGSSALDLANDINEPATGRTIEYNMFPFSLAELANETSEREEKRMLNHRLIYGTYPDVVNYPAEAKETLALLTKNYLYKDILSYKGIKKPEMLFKLVKALSLQIGSEVSYNELSNLIGIDKETVENYITLLEKCFIVFKIDSFSRNMRNEIKKGKKIYFYDNGIRNALISNFAPEDARTDMGALWENFMMSERIKRNAYNGSYAQLYFWRTQEQSEIDLVEEIDGQLHTFEFKLNPRKKVHMPKPFASNYPNSTFTVVTPDNFWEFVK